MHKILRLKQVIYWPNFVTRRRFEVVNLFTLKQKHPSKREIFRQTYKHTHTHTHLYEG